MKTELTSGRIEPGLARSLERGGLWLAVAGLLAGGVAAVVDLHRFAFSYLVGFAFVVTLALGGLLFVLIQHLTRAAWSSAARRQMEWLAGVLPACALLFVPVAVLAPKIYHWLDHDAAAHDALLQKKAAYLNLPAFLARAALFFGVWSLVAWLFRRTSRAQDASAEPETLMLKMQRWSAPAILATGVTLTFAAFDWLMSLDPHWYSTIFGVYVLSGGLVSALAALALGTVFLERRGVYGPVSTVEHRHDIGKLLFGFTVFWAYIAFSQYFLIWYANIPEETIFFRRRWVGSWQAVSLVLVFGHFAVPFVMLMSRHAKRSMTTLGAAAGLLLAMHYVDLYWLVMPTLDAGGARPGLIDAAGLLFPLGVLAAWLGRRAAREPAYPIRDPRLPETIRLENF